MRIGWADVVLYLKKKDLIFNSTRYILSSFYQPLPGDKEKGISLRDSNYLEDYHHVCKKPLNPK